MMWNLLGILTVTGLITLYEYPKMKKKSMKYEIKVFFLLLGIGTTLAILYIYDIPIPNPLNFLKYIFEPAGKLIMGN
jgi:hypothetical protein